MGRIITQEEKSLLLQDLCARLPYGVVVRHADYLADSDGNHTGQFWYKRGYLYDICRIDNITTTIIESEGSDEEGYEHICDLERSLPYLRPMSSMTEDEKRQYEELCDEDIRQLTSVQIVHPGLKYKTSCHRSVDWLNAHHFDYHRLIPMGLALEAPKRMYNLKEK